MMCRHLSANDEVALLLTTEVVAVKYPSGESREEMKTKRYFLAFHVKLILLFPFAPCETS